MIDTAKEREYLKSQYGVGGRRYRFADPISGLPVWRYSPGLWNGQRPLEAEDLYTHSVYLTASAALDALDAQAAEIGRLREALAIFTRHYEPWMDEHPDAVMSSSHSRHTFGDLRRARAALSEREP